MSKHHMTDLSGYPAQRNSRAHWTVFCTVCAVCGVQNKLSAIRGVLNVQSVWITECALHSVPDAQCVVYTVP